MSISHRICKILENCNSTFSFVYFPFVPSFIFTGPFDAFIVRWRSPFSIRISIRFAGLIDPRTIENFENSNSAIQTHFDRFFLFASEIWKFTILNLWKFIRCAGSCNIHGFLQNAQKWRNKTGEKVFWTSKLHKFYRNFDDPNKIPLKILSRFGLQFDFAGPDSKSPDLSLQSPLLLPSIALHFHELYYFLGCSSFRSSIQQSSFCRPCALPNQSDLSLVKLSVPSRFAMLLALMWLLAADDSQWGPQGSIPKDSCWLICLPSLRFRSSSPSHRPFATLPRPLQSACSQLLKTSWAFSRPGRFCILSFHKIQHTDIVYPRHFYAVTEMTRRCSKNCFKFLSTKFICLSLRIFISLVRAKNRSGQM